VLPQLEQVLLLPAAEIAVEVILLLVDKVPVQHLLFMGLGRLPTLGADDVSIIHVELLDMVMVIVEVGELRLAVDTLRIVIWGVLHM